jgi:hypothetical protein
LRIAKHGDSSSELLAPFAARPAGIAHGKRQALQITALRQQRVQEAVLFLAVEVIDPGNLDGH